MVFKSSHNIVGNEILVSKDGRRFIVMGTHSMIKINNQNVDFFSLSEEEKQNYINSIPNEDCIKID